MVAKVPRHRVNAAHKRPAHGAHGAGLDFLPNMMLIVIANMPSAINSIVNHNASRPGRYRSRF